MKKELVEKVISVANAMKEQKVAFHVTDGAIRTGATIPVDGRQIKFFGNCDYMGLIHDDRIKKAAINAIEQYGLLMSSSRHYVSCELNEIWEDKLKSVFGNPVLIGRSTTQCSIAAIPLLAGPKDAILVDMQVHASVQLSAQLASANGTYVEIVAHNYVARLEDKIRQLKSKYEKIWYLADGVYSMFGDRAPVKEICALLDVYDNFHVYFDDAWGLSWAGENGRGFVLDEAGSLHSRMVLATSFEKSFGAGGGGGLIFSDEISKQLIKIPGSTFIFSGPPDHASVGAGIASADIHLSTEIYERQTKLLKLIHVFKVAAEECNIRMATKDITPVQYVIIGDSEATIAIVQDLYKKGYQVNMAHYPAVPLNKCGVRVVINLYHTEEEVALLVYELADSIKKFGVRKREILQEASAI
jgi:7-keto-8-aminopelargonate synthetase-like enzyme